MDQARTLRNLLNPTEQRIIPIIGTHGTLWHDLLCTSLFNYHARQGLVTLVFDGGILFDNPKPGSDLLAFLMGRANLEDLVISPNSEQHLLPSAKGFKYLQGNPALAFSILNRLHRLPVTCDRMYATVGLSQVASMSQLNATGDWFWLVEPKAQSVTDVFRAIKGLSCGFSQVQHKVIVAGTSDADEADHVYTSLLETTTFLTRALQYCGYLPHPDSKGGSLAKVAAEEGARVAQAMTTARQAESNVLHL